MSDAQVDEKKASVGFDASGREIDLAELVFTGRGRFRRS